MRFSRERGAIVSNGEEIGIENRGRPADKPPSVHEGYMHPSRSFARAICHTGECTLREITAKFRRRSGRPRTLTD